MHGKGCSGMHDVISISIDCVSHSVVSDSCDHMDLTVYRNKPLSAAIARTTCQVCRITTDALGNVLEMYLYQTISMSMKRYIP